MTQRLYFTDATLLEFDATVVAVDGVRVTLDRTAFYPTSGGQQFDTGRLGTSQVVDVIDDAAGIVHLLGSPAPFAVGDSVHGAVDSARRFDHMQQHTGQHLLSALLDDMARAPTVSVHFGAESSTIDVDLPALSLKRATEIEARANAIVAENRPVRVAFEDASTAAGLRKPSDRTGEIRIVTIADIDRSACGGTHVSATGQIGAVLIRKLEKYKQMTRVEFYCGARATRRARRDFDALGEMAGALSAGIDDLPAIVRTQHESVRALESESRKLRESLAAYRIRELRDAAPAASAGIRRVTHTSASADDLRALAQAAGALPATIFVGSCESPLTIVYAASEDSGINAGAALKSALTANGGRGGGSPRAAQGTVPSKEALAAVVAALAG